MRIHTPDGFITSLDLCRRAGITYRELDYWVRTGLVTPFAQAASGSGSQRLWYVWQLGEVLEVKMAKRVAANLLEGIKK